MTKIIKSIGPRSKQISKKEIITLLGAEKLDKKVHYKTGPTSLLALRNLVKERLRSTGGRPSLENLEGNRRKISLIEGDYNLLKQLAEKCSQDDYKVSPSQLIACIIHKELNRISL